jgi:two-component system chemotaxis sensor kinase CheA
VIDDLEASDAFRAMFLDEATERIDSMVATLLALEKGENGPDTVDSLFRDTHSIKGGAGMLGLEEVGALAHAMEDVLEGMRDAASVPADLADRLLRATDGLRRHVAGETADTAAVIAELTAGDESATELTETVAAPVAPSPGAATKSAAKAIRVAPEKIDRLLDLVGESVLHKRRLDHVIGGEQVSDGRTVTDELDLGEQLLDELKDMAIGMRTLPLSSIAGPLPRAVRDVAQATGKEAELTIAGAETELDRAILESLAEPLVHMLRNAVGHGIELPDERERLGKPRCGRIELRAEQRGGSVELVIADDGRGVAPELIEEGRRGGSLADVLTRPGFSTAAEVTDLAGRGVGLDAVKRDVESLGGSLEVRSEPGKGTEIVLRVPLALALLDVLLLERGGSVYGIPLASVEEVLAVTDQLSLEGRASFEVRGRSVALVDLTTAIGAAPAPAGTVAAVVSTAGRRVGVLCDSLLGKEEIIVKPLGSLLGPLTAYLGGAILGDGRIALLLDPARLVAAPRATHRAGVAPRSAEPRRLSPKVLVVEDSFTVRELQRSILEAAGYRVTTAHDGRDGYERLVADEEIELVVTDVEMPEMTGVELTAAIRAHAQRGSTPVVIVTSLDDADARQRGVEAGADAYIVKRSFDQRTLLDTVERLVGR